MLYAHIYIYIYLYICIYIYIYTYISYNVEQWSGMWVPRAVPYNILCSVTVLLRLVNGPLVGSPRDEHASSKAVFQSSGAVLRLLALPTLFLVCLIWISCSYNPLGRKTSWIRKVLLFLLLCWPIMTNRDVHMSIRLSWHARRTLLTALSPNPTVDKKASIIGSGPVKEAGPDCA